MSHVLSPALMNSGWPSHRFSEPRFSTRWTTAASKPTPVWKQKNRPFTRPSPIGRRSAASMPPASSSTAATGSLGMPIVRANTFVEPPGSTPSAVSVPAIPVATSLSVPSPPNPIDDVDASAGGVVGEPGGVAAAVRLDDLDLVVRGSAGDGHDRVARRHRRRERVDDQQDLQRNILDSTPEVGR